MAPLLDQSGGRAITLSPPSFLPASTGAPIPPKAAAEVASLTLTPEDVSPPVLSFWGGAHASRPAMTSADAAETANTDLFIAKPSDGREAARWRRGYGAGSPR